MEVVLLGVAVLVVVVLVMMIVIDNKNIDQFLYTRYILAVLPVFTHLILRIP